MNKTLLVDGNNLAKIGFHGVKTYFHNGEHIGAIWYFLSTIRLLIEENNFDKVVVFWDGEESWLNRRKIYANYKTNRGKSKTDEEEQSFYKQCNRIKKYLEEVFIRQIILENCEADDLIAYYCQISKDETKVILSADNDLQQLCSEQTTIYSPILKKYYKYGDKVKIKTLEIPNYNVKPYKILCGDNSDNIDGIYCLGPETLLKFFPELFDKKVSVSDILEKTEKLFEENKSRKVLANILTGKTKTGIYGDEFYVINEKIIDLDNPIISDEVKLIVEDHYKEDLDPDGRDYKNLMKMMVEDGIFKLLPKTDNAWVYFFKPFMKISRKEKFKNKKK